MSGRNRAARWDYYGQREMWGEKSDNPSMWAPSGLFLARKGGPQKQTLAPFVAASNPISISRSLHLSTGAWCDGERGEQRPVCV